MVLRNWIISISRKSTKNITPKRMKHPPGKQPRVPSSSPKGLDDDSPLRKSKTSTIIIRYIQKLIRDAKLPHNM